MRLSVVIIAYNLEAYVDAAISSVLGQTRRADEIIVVDDCSTDSTSARIRAYGDKVRYVKMEENSGALLAALQGVKLATGDVLCMLDGDDVWAPNKLEVIEREFARDAGLLLLSHDHVRVDQNGVELRVKDETHANIAALQRKAKSARQFSDLLAQAVLDQRGYWLGSAYSFRRSLFDAAKFDAQIATFDRDRLKKTYLDLVIAPFLVLTNPGKRVGYTGDTRFFYRVHGAGSLAGNTTPGKAIESARKGRAINELIELVLRANGAAPAHLQRRRLILEEYDYLVALYAGRLATAMRLFLRLAARSWNSRTLAKEAKRIIAVAILGPSRFLRWKSRA